MLNSNFLVNHKSFYALIESCISFFTAAAFVFTYVVADSAQTAANGLAPVLCERSAYSFPDMRLQAWNVNVAGQELAWGHVPIRDKTGFAMFISDMSFVFVTEMSDG